MCQPPAGDAEMSESTLLLCKKRSESERESDGERDKQMYSSGLRTCWRGVKRKGLAPVRQASGRGKESSAKELMHKWGFEATLGVNRDLRQLVITLQEKRK